MLEGEQKLVERAKSGDSSAFGLLYDYYLPRIYRFVLIKVGQREVAEDITHLAFLKAWENIDRYFYRGYSFGSWLYKVARNTLTDHYRDRNSSTQVHLDDIFIEPESDKPRPGENIDIKLESERIMAALLKLSALEQDVVIMRLVDDLPTKEVAEAVGKSEGAIKLIQHRAIKKLKELL
ncbi:MAG: RNA polymerase sigma factor [Patescibacteria group bacterium]|nr:RNA polymerase sigma factor [Patescibacteria group bacterium]MCL5224426.1 RNA polymerase sigma factor [Patescibacteria group bacterium]